MSMDCEDGINERAFDRAMTGRTMNKSEAKARIYAGITVGELREVIRNGSRSGVAKLNRGLTKAQAAEILGAGLNGRPDSDVIKPETYGARGYRMSGEAIVASNILREFAAGPRP